MTKSLQKCVREDNTAKIEGSEIATRDTCANDGTGKNTREIVNYQSITNTYGNFKWKDSKTLGVLLLEKALPQFRWACCKIRLEIGSCALLLIRRPGSMKDAETKQIKLRSPVHRALDQLQSMGMRQNWDQGPVWRRLFVIDWQFTMLSSFCFSPTTCSL